MGRLAEKYNIPPEVVKKMVNDGVISCSWPMRDDIYDMYKKLSASGKSQGDIIYEIAQAKHVSESTVKQTIQKLR